MTTSQQPSPRPSLLPKGHPDHAIEPLARTRAFTGQVLPMPCSNDDCPHLDTVPMKDDEWSLQQVLELYRGCVVRVMVELIEPRPLLAPDRPDDDDGSRRAG